MLKAAPLPEDIKKLGVEGVTRIWRDAKLSGWDEEGKDPGNTRRAQCWKQRRAGISPDGTG